MTQIDPTQLVGILSFLSAAVLTWFASKSEPAGHRTRWRLMTTLHLLLAIETVATTRFAVGAIARELLVALNLYPDRGLLQLAIIIILLVLVLLLIWGCVRRAASGGAVVATASSLFLILLFLIECVSLHAIDAMLYQTRGPILLIGWLWLGSALATASGAAASVVHEP